MQLEFLILIGEYLPMDELIMEELKAINVLSSKNVLDFKKYIFIKYAKATAKEKADILADAIRKTINEKIPKVEKSLRTNLVDNLIKSSIKQGSFDINSENVFIECLNLKGSINEDAFLLPLCSWLNEVTAKDIQKENIKQFIHSIYSLDAEAYNLENISIALKNTIQEKFNDCKDSNDISDLHFESDQVSKVSAIDKSVVEISENPFYKSKLIFKSNVKWFKLKDIAIGMSIVILIFSLKINIFGYNYLTQSDTNNTKSHQQSVSQYIPTKIVSENNNQYVNIMESLIKSVHIQKETIIDEKKSQKEEILIMKATAYDLSIESCSKPRNHPMYGITFSGIKATKGRTVAVDPAVIPLGSRLYIKFPKSYSKLDGIYVAEDTGSEIKGSDIDIFFGEDKIGESIVHEEANNFGIRMVEVSLVK